MTSLIAATALILPSFILLQNPGMRGEQSFKNAPSIQIAPRSSASKLAAVKESLKLPLPPAGLTGFATLTVRQPYLAGRALLKFIEFHSVDTQYGPFGRAIANTQAKPSVEVWVKIARPGKIHILTCYFSAGANQDLHVMKYGATNQTYYLKYSGSPQSVVYAFIPAAAGDATISIQPGNSFHFYKVEMDVVD